MQVFTLLLTSCIQQVCCMQQRPATKLAIAAMVAPNVASMACSHQKKKKKKKKKLALEPELSACTGWLMSALSPWPKMRLGHVTLLLSRWLFKPQLSLAAAAVIAMLVPFFVDVVGLLGSLGFWPLTVFLPIQMHIAQTG